MSSHSVSAFEITVRNSEIKGKDKNSVLDSMTIGGKGYDFLDVIESFLKSHLVYKTFLVNKGNRLVKVEKIQRTKNGRDLSFYVRQGAYGAPGEIISAKSLKTTYSRASHESDVSAYFVQIRIPKDSKTGYAILHSIGNVGVKSWLADRLGEYVNQKSSKCAFRLRPLCSTLALKTYLKDAEVRSLRISHFEPNASTDIANFLNDEKVEKTLTLKREGGFGKLGGFLSKGKKRDQLIALSDENCNDVKADVTFNGRSRTISLEGSKTPKAKFYLTEPDTKFDDGLPTHSSIAAYATALLDDLVNESTAGK